MKRQSASERTASEKRSHVRVARPLPMSTRGYFSPSATNALARLFEVVHEGVYLGSLDATGSATVAANPHLKLMFGYAADAPDKSVRPFDPDRFVDPQIR